MSERAASAFDELFDLRDPVDPRLELLTLGLLTRGEIEALEAEASRDPDLRAQVELYRPLESRQAQAARPQAE